MQVYRGFDSSKISAARLRVNQLVAFGFLSLSAGYFVWRILYTLEGANPLVASLLLGVELYTAATGAGYFFALWGLRPTKIPAAPLPSQAHVDILLPTYNEPFEILAPAVAAAVEVRAVRDVWVLDDGNRDWVQQLAEQLGARYLTRPEKSHAKAGNLNHALKYTDAEFVLVLDADHIPSPHFVEHTLPYLQDPEVALVQTPQDFYNLNSFEHMNSGANPFMEEELFYRGLLAGRDAINGTFWCGTGALIRTEALRSIGGVPTTSITEDILATIKLHKAGWKTRHHNEVLARGLAAANIDQYQTQRLRWGNGAMQVLRNEPIITSNKLTWRQKGSYLSTLLGWFDAWRTLIAMLIPSIVLLTGWEPLTPGEPIFILVIFGFFAVGQLAMEVMSYGLSSWRSTLLFEIAKLPTSLQATLSLLNNKPQSFKVTNKVDIHHESTVYPTHWLIKALMWLMGLSIAVPIVRYFLEDDYYFEDPWTAVVSACWAALNLVALFAVSRRIQSRKFGTTRRLAGRIESQGTAHFGELEAQVFDLSVGGAKVSLGGEAPKIGTVSPLRISIGGVNHEVAAELISEDKSSSRYGVRFLEAEKNSAAKLFAAAVIQNI